jgi:uncharacterized protein
MFIDIHATEPELISFDESLQLTGMQMADGEPLLVRRALLKGRARRESDGVKLRARLEASVEIPCSRCLEPYRTEIDSDFRLILVPEAVEYGVGETEMSERESLLFYAENGRAELDAIAQEQIYLNLPLKPLCRQDCLGLCPTCGINRNRLKCGCRSEETDPRLAPLLELKKKMEDS